MSSSTVSITANPSGAVLRRPLLTGEKKSGVDLGGSDGIEASARSGGETSRGKDLSHSFRAGAETVLERSRDAVQTKNPLPTNSTTKTRKRTADKKVSVPSTTKAPWKRAVSVLMKNFALLVILLLLAQMIRKLAFNQGSGFDSILIPSSDYESQFAEVEARLKSTTQAMQFQVDVMNQKMVEEIVGLKTELTKRIADKGAELSSRVNDLDGKFQTMKKTLTTDWLSRDEFNRFVEDFKSKKGMDDVNKLNLDEVRAFAKEIVEKEISKHAADGLGMVDYAVASGGAMVLKHSEPYLRMNKLFSKWISGNVHSDAVKILQPSFGQPGECFPLKGDNGFVEIKLRTAVIPEAITLEHVSKSVAFDRSSAPKECKVSGWLGKEEGTEKMLTEFTYDLEKSNAQTYNTDLNPNPSAMDTIRFEFVSNHGSPSHTCIYRVRKLKFYSTSHIAAGEDIEGNPSLVTENSKRAELYRIWVCVESLCVTLLNYSLYYPEKSNAQTFNINPNPNPSTMDTIRLEFVSNHGSPDHTCNYRVRSLYSPEKSNAQTLNTNPNPNPSTMDTIRLEFVSNHGSPGHTCSYRVRVHSHEPNLV
ncbi:hypothetical protein LXL04_028633 [Taraxacum kok-saghyz]